MHEGCSHMRERNVHSLIDIRSSEDGDNRASGIVLSGGMHIELSGDFAGPFRTNSEIYEPQWTFENDLVTFNVDGVSSY